MYDLCFDWKAAEEGREVILIGGDIHTGLIHDLKDNTTGAVIKSITTSPITNHVCQYWNPLEGKFNDRYTFTAEHFPEKRNFVKLEVSFAEGTGNCSVNTEMELFECLPHEEE